MTLFLLGLVFCMAGKYHRPLKHETEDFTCDRSNGHPIQKMLSVILEMQQL